MIPDLAWWGQLFGLLATEAALLVALAAAGARWSRSAHWRRLIWQSAFMAVALVWSVELAGGRGWLAQWRPVPEPPRQVTARLIGDAPVVGEQVTFEFPTEVPVVVPAQRQEPRWWPGLLWLGGMLALLLKTLGSRAWLAWRIRAVPGHEVGQAASLPTGAASARLAACPTLAEALPAEGGDLDGLADVTATVTRLRPALGVGPVRLVTWPQLRSPVAFGIVRPTVAVPAEFAERFPPAQREAMLAHELGHLAQRDPLWLLVADLVCALAWWHPVVWWARRQFRAACEAAADEASALIPGGRVALAEALVNFGRELTAPGGVGVGGSGLRSELARRVKALVEQSGDVRAVRAPGRWLLRSGTVAVLGTLLLAPWPGDHGGLGPMLAAVRAEKPLQTISEVLADPQFRKVVKALEASDRGPNAGAEGEKIRALAERPSDEQPLETRPPELAKANPGTGFDRIPLFEFPGESLLEAANRLSLAARDLKPEGVRLEITFADRELEAIRVRQQEPIRNAALTKVLSALVQAAETPIQSSLENGEVLFARQAPLSPEAQARFRRAAHELRDARLALDEARVQERSETPALKAAEARHEDAKRALHDVARQTQLMTRQFRLSPAHFTAHLQQFLPQGETNAQALQLAIRAFCATNGIEFPTMVTNASGVTPPQDQPATFYNDRTGVLFVRATLENLDRLEHAIQRLNLLPAPIVDKAARRTVLTRLEQHEALLPELRARLPDDHPEVLVLRAEISGLRHQLEVMQRGGDGTAERIAVTRAELLGHLKALGITYTELLSRYRERHPLVAEVAWKQAALQAKLQTLPLVTNAVVTAKIGDFEPAPPLFTRQFRVDSAKFIARVMTEFDPAEAARRLDSIPNRELIASDVGAAVSSAALPGVVGKGTTNGPHLGEAIHAYFRKHGVHYPLSTSQGVTSAVAPERPAVFFKPDSGVLFVRATLEDMAKLESALAGLESQVAASSGNQSLQVELSVTLVEIADGGSDDVGLDWLFGQAATNNPPVVSALATNLPGSAGALQGNRLTVDRLAVEGQSAVLSGEQFAALRERLGTRNQVDFLSAPKVITLSGRQAQVSIAEVRTLVTGVVAENGSTTNDAGIRYLTESVPVGPVVDLFPLAAGDAWQVRVVAAVTEFLGYDQPAKSDRVRATTAEGKVLQGTTPLPRLRVRETQSTVTAKVGEVIALRGPLAENVVRYKDKVPVLGDVPLLGRLFRKEGSQVQRKRLYVFVQPATIDAQGNRPLSK